MGFTVPVSGNQALASHVGQIAAALNTYKARALNNANQAALVASTWTKVALQNKDYDPGASFDAVTNYRYVSLAGGYYLVSGLVSFIGTLTAQNRLLAAIYKNGTEVPGTRTGTVTSQTTTAVPVDVAVAPQVIQLLVGDYVELFAFTSVAIGLNGSASEFCALSVHFQSLS